MKHRSIICFKTGNNVIRTYKIDIFILNKITNVFIISKNSHPSLKNKFNREYKCRKHNTPFLISLLYK